MVFGVGLDHFFVDSAQRPLVVVTRRADRLRLPNRPGDATPTYLFESLNFPATDRKLDVYLAEFPRLQYRRIRTSTREWNSSIS